MNGDRTPPRDRIAAVLRRRISDGELRPGTRLPTQQRLEAEFGVNRTVVRQALEMLKNEGLVAMGRGAPATVSAPEQRHRDPEGPAPAGVLLTDRLYAAFQAEHVTIDAFSLTTETLNRALSPALNAVVTHQLAPRSVTVRVMLPGPDARLALPRLVADPEDVRPLDRLHKLTTTFVGVLRANLDSLLVHDTVRTSLEIRSVPVTPLHKLYLLNGTESLLGYYNVVPRSVDLQQEDEEEIYDVLGIEAELFRSSRDVAQDARGGRDDQASAFVEASQLWFESLWSTIAHPLTLG